MSNIDNQVNNRNIYKYKNNDINENLSRPFNTQVDDVNEYLPTKIQTERNKNKKNLESLTYKSLFPQNKTITKNNGTYNGDRINANYNRNRNNENIFSPKNTVNRQNKPESNYITYLKKLNNSSQKEKKIQVRNQFYIPKEEKNMLNYSEIKDKTNNYLNNDINDKKKYFNYKRYNKLSLNTSENIKYNINTFNKEGTDLKLNIYSKTQKNEENFDKMLDKNDFIKNIKEIDDLNYLDDIDIKNVEYLSTTENINNFNYFGRNNNPLSTDRLIKEIDSYNNIQLESKDSKISNLNKNNQMYNFNIDINETFKNDYNINANKENNSKGKYKSKLVNDMQRNDKKIFSQINKSYKNKFIISHNPLNDLEKSDNYLLQKETNNRFSTMSQMDKKIKSISKNISMQFKELALNNSKLNLKGKAINIKNLPNKYTRNVDENIYNSKVRTNQENNMISKLKEKIRQLSNVIVGKDNKIKAFIKIIKESKEKNDNLVKNNILLNEENKKIKGIAIKFRNQLNVFKNLKTQNNLNNKDFSENNVNINYNYITNNDKMQTKIKELEQQIEKYKKENNNLKLLLNKYKNNNNDRRNNKENLLNKFNSSYQLYDNHRKTSYSVSKNKRILSSSFFLSKVFKEDEM